jgi:hypothetical protein
MVPFPVPSLPPYTRGAFNMQRYAAEQQYYVDLYSVMVAGSWQPYVKNYAPNLTFDYGSRIATLWLNPS